MYAEQHEITKLYNLRDLTLTQLQAIEIELNSIHLNKEEHVEGSLLQNKIDADLG
jgi:hypothetical protein